MKQKIMAMLMTLIMSLSILSVPASAACRVYRNCPKCGSTSYSTTYETRKSCSKKTTKGWFGQAKKTYWQEHGHIERKCNNQVKSWFRWKACGKKYLVKCDKGSSARHTTKGAHVYNKRTY